MTRFKTCLYRLTMHPFTFHLPFPNHPNPIRKFLNIVAASFLINWALILSLYLCDRQGYLTRDDWTGKFAINVRPQRMDDAGCEYASDDRTNFLAQPVTSLSNFAFSFSGLIVLAFSYYDFLNMNTSHAPSQLIATQPLLSLFLAGTLCLMATTSFIWHASLATHGANIDFGAMYVLIGYIITLCLLRMLAYVPGWIGTRKLLAVAIHVVSFSGKLLVSIVVTEDGRGRWACVCVRRVCEEHSSNGARRRAPRSSSCAFVKACPTEFTLRVFAECAIERKDRVPAASSKGTLCHACSRRVLTNIFTFQAWPVASPCTISRRAATR